MYVLVDILVSLWTSAMPVHHPAMRRSSMHACMPMHIPTAKPDIDMHMPQLQIGLRGGSHAWHSLAAGPVPVPLVAETAAATAAAKATTAAAAITTASPAVCTQHVYSGRFIM